MTESHTPDRHASERPTSGTDRRSAADDAPPPIRLLLAEPDNAIRSMIRGWLRDQPDILIIAETLDGASALRLTRSHQPDILLLAVNIPLIDGAELVAVLRREKGPPALMLASGGATGITAAMRAMRAGAVDFLAISADPVIQGDPTMQQALTERLRNWSGKRHTPAALPPLPHRPGLRLPQRPMLSGGDAVASGQRGKRDVCRHDLIVIGASTGGPEAVRDLLTELGPTICPIIIAQHMPVSFTSGFAKSLTRQLNVAVVESQPGMVVKRSSIIVLRGGEDWTLMRAASGMMSLLPVRSGVQGSDNKDGSRRRALAHHPSVNRLFLAAAEFASNPIGVVMTGMGDDGTEGAHALFSLGHPVLAQDPLTCAVGGMPGSAIRAGVVNDVLPVAGLARALNILLSKEFA